MTALFSITRASGLDAQRGRTTEWLQTNGLGDYASSTLEGVPTRRYHGLLVVRPEGREKRYVLCSRLVERVRLGPATGQEAPLALESFALDPHPIAHLRGPGVELVREFQLVRGRCAALVRYASAASEPVTLELRPFLPYREADDLTFRNPDACLEARLEDVGCAFRPYEVLPWLWVTPRAGLAFVPAPRWEEGIDLPVERERGYPHREDHPSPGLLRAVLAPGEALVLGLSTEGPLPEPAALWEEQASRRLGDRATAAAATKGCGPSEARSCGRLFLAAEDFLVEMDGRLGVDAGFPWFGEWGRDTFIALPGLTLARGRLADCERVLSESLAYLDAGLLPNIFGLSRATSHYGSADAALWYARAVLCYDRAGGSRERLLEEYLPALEEIASCYRDGTGLAVRADDAGLLVAGSTTLNATWMDARTPAGPVTPRAGCAVELNGLWYALLAHLEELLGERGRTVEATSWRRQRERTGRAFVERLWLAEERRLADVWCPEGPDRSLRPNMVLAAALELSPLGDEQRRAVVEQAERHLLTPVGLRTLSPEDPQYRSRFEGGPEQRDAAYHQGTVWPWLFGFHVEASLRAYPDDAPRARRLRAGWSSILAELDRAGLEHVSEVFDGDAPHRPGGTIAQAWNTAELLRAHRLLEDAGA